MLGWVQHIVKHLYCDLFVFVYVYTTVGKLCSLKYVNKKKNYNSKKKIYKVLMQPRQMGCED